MWMKASNFCICWASSKSLCVPIAFSCKACLKRAGKEQNAFHWEEFIKSKPFFLTNNKQIREGVTDNNTFDQNVFKQNHYKWYNSLTAAGHNADHLIHNVVLFVLKVVFCFVFFFLTSVTVFITSEGWPRLLYGFASLYIACAPTVLKRAESFKQQHLR